MIEGGGVTINDQVITDSNYVVDLTNIHEIIVKYGKRQFVKGKIED